MTNHSTFRSLHNRNFKLYTGGQLVSVTGTGMQQVAQSWLVLDLTGSGVALGVTVALQFLPMLLFGVWGGLLADRADKRRLLMVTQAAQGVLALALWVLVFTGTVTLWHVYVLAFLLGCAFAVDMPTRQSFTMEMVGHEHVSNAVALNSAVFNSGRLVGPAVGGVIIASMGIGPCFLINGVSYVATVLALRAMRTEELIRHEPAAREPAQVRAGLRYAWDNQELRRTLLLVAIVGTLGINTFVVLPLLAKDVFGGGPRLLGTLIALQGLGALVGALAAARRAAPTRAVLVGAAAAFGVFELATAVSPTAGLAGLFTVAMGAATMVFLATANSTLQLASDPRMRGRVMALYGLVFLGSSPIGGPIIGAISEQWGPRMGLAVGGVACLAAAAVAVPSLWRPAPHRRARAEPVLAPAAGGGISPGGSVDGV